jgi:hypothetical protein
MTSTSNKQPVHFYRYKYDIEKALLESLTTHFYRAIEVYQQLELDPLLPGEVQRLFIDFHNLIVFKLTKSADFSINGHKVANENVFNFLQKPKAYDALKDVVTDSCSFVLKQLSLQSAIKMQNKTDLNEWLSFYDFQNLENICLSESHLARMREAYEVHCTNEDSEKIYQFAVDLKHLVESTDLKHLIQKTYSAWSNYENFMGKVLVWRNEKLTINYGIIENFNNSRRDKK